MALSNFSEDSQTSSGTAKAQKPLGETIFVSSTGLSRQNPRPDFLLRGIPPAIPLPVLVSEVL